MGQADRWASKLKSAVKRLEGSESRRVARRNAHRDLDKLLSGIRRELRREFPNYSKDGAVVVHEIALPDGQKSCGICRVYVGTFRKLAVHLLDKHGRACPCSFVPKKVSEAQKMGRFNSSMNSGSSPWLAIPSYYGTDAMVAHLRGLKEDLRTHVLVGAIGGIGKKT